MALLDLLGIEAPIVQAGMGGGISRHELAVAVSEAGGLGTIAVSGAEAIERELSAARALTDRPIAVNLLLPFARRSWFEAAAAADVVVTFWGRPKRRGGGIWFHQCGSIAEARAAYAAGADAVIVQGVEAGGHVRGSAPALELLARVRAVVPVDFPLLVAGGIAERDDVSRALEAGAAAAVAGTRFLLSEESRARREYRQRLCDADATILTDLFGLSWPAPHRVVPNAATERWLSDASSGVAIDVCQHGPGLNRMLNRASGLLARRAPARLQQQLIRAQRAHRRLLTPQGPSDDAPLTLLDAGPLYAGDTIRRIRAVRPAAHLVADMTP